MQIEPSEDAFRVAYERGETQLVSTSLVADLETPVSTFLKIAGERPNAFLLESVEGGAVRGRYSILGFDPDLIWRVKDGAVSIARASARGGLGEFASVAGKPLDLLRALLAESRIAIPDGMPPMSAGVFGFLGYDMVREMEALGPANPDPLGIADAVMIRPRLIAVFDAVRDTLTLVTPVRPSPELSAEAAHRLAVERLTSVVEALDAKLPRDLTGDALPFPEDAVSNTSPERYKAMVLKAKDYIAAGDAFQIVLSQRFSTPFALPAFSLYRALRRINPSPFLYFLRFEDFSLVGSSPEILVRVRDGKVTIRPIAGTRPRGATPAEDQALGEELLADPKERAEHLMLLDLGRNDVGRVAEIGSVTVTDSFFLEHYSHVMHIVSNVEGRLAPGKDEVDALIAGFPAGTVSGAPKVRTMEIIDELEAEKRGPYAGCVGYFAADGAMDTCIVLRTAVVKDGVIHVQAGAGIVADSNPDSEQRECENKAKALFRAANEAVRFASAGGRGQ